MLKTAFKTLLLGIGVCVISLNPASPGYAQKQEGDANKPKILRFALRNHPGSFNPTLIGTIADYQLATQLFDTLLEVDYYKRPLEIVPNLLEEMPTFKDDPHSNRRTWSFQLEKGIKFHPDPNCPDLGPNGRDLVAKDVFYSWKRMAFDNTDKEFSEIDPPKNWEDFKGLIVGFDEYRKRQNELAADPGVDFDFDAEVEGLVEDPDDPYRFQVILTGPQEDFLERLTYQTTAVIAREAIEFYDSRFAYNHPIGTGPFMITPGSTASSNDITFTKNPHYHQKDPITQKRLPLVDGIEWTVMAKDQTRWLEFKGAKQDIVEVPYDYVREAIGGLRSKRYRVKPNWIRNDKSRRQGAQLHVVNKLHFFHIGFNMDDEDVGVVGDEERDAQNLALRQAMAMATDLDEINDVFFKDCWSQFDGPIPPGVIGHPDPENEELPEGFVGYGAEEAKKHLTSAGFTLEVDDGNLTLYRDGKTVELTFYHAAGGSSPELVELFERQMSDIGVKIIKRGMPFANMLDAVSKKKPQLFIMGSYFAFDDPIHMLGKFYGPYESPGNNTFNYKDRAFDEAYQRLQYLEVLEVGTDEHLQTVRKMRDMIIADVPMIGSLNNTSFYLAYRWVRNYQPHGSMYSWPRYVDIDTEDPSYKP